MTTEPASPATSQKTTCCEEYGSCTVDCIPRLHWHDSLRSEIKLTAERAERIASFLWGYNGPNQEVAWQYSNDLTAALKNAAPQVPTKAGADTPAGVSESKPADAAPSTPSATRRMSEIEDAIAAGKMDAPMVFTKMREVVNSMRPSLVEKPERPVEPQADAWVEICGVLDEVCPGWDSSPGKHLVERASRAIRSLRSAIRATTPYPGTGRLVEAYTPTIYDGQLESAPPPFLNISEAKGPYEEVIITVRSPRKTDGSPGESAFIVIRKHDLRHVLLKAARWLGWLPMTEEQWLRNYEIEQANPVDRTTNQKGD